MELFLKVKLLQGKTRQTCAIREVNEIDNWVKAIIFRKNSTIE